MRPNIFKLLANKQNKQNFDIQSDPTDFGPSADYFGDTSPDFGASQYDEDQMSTGILKDGHALDYLRGERQDNWDKLGNGLVNMGGKAFTTAVEGIVNPFYGTIAALTNTDKNGNWDPSFNSYYNNALTQSLDNINQAVEANNPFYETKKEATATGLDKLWSFNTIARDILGGAGTTIGAAVTGYAWAKGISALSKGLAAVSTAEEAAALLAEAKAMGASPDKLQYLSNEVLKQTIKDGAKQGTIALASATGEAGAEAREAERNIFTKLTTNPDGSPKQMTESELEYAKMISKQAGDAAFAMNVPVIMADNWLTFGKALFGNKTNDFAKIVKENTILDAATGTYKAVEKTTSDVLKYRLGKLFVPMVSEGTQEQLQFAIGKTAEDYYVKKYYNPNAANFADSMVKGLAEAYTSEEGWYSGIIGALSAGIASPGIVAAGGALQGKGLQTFKDEFITNPEDKIVQDGVALLNKYKAEDFRNKIVNGFVRSQNLSEDKDNAAANKDVHAYQNAAEDLIFQYAYNRMVNGKLDDVYKELEQFKDLTVEELKNTYGIDVNTASKSSIDQLTSKNAVRNFVESRIEKLKQVEKTYKDITDLNPELHPDIKELLTYSAQGIYNAKQRKTQLAEETASLLPKLDMLTAAAAINNDPNALLTSLSYNPQAFGTTYSKLTNNQKQTFKEQVSKSEDINPLDKDKILINLEDLEKLEKREKDFVNTYTTLKNPAKQKEFLEKADKLWSDYSILEQKEKAKSNQNSKPEATESSPEVNNEQLPVENKPVQETSNEWFNDDTTEEELTVKLKDAISKGMSPNQAMNIFDQYAKQKDAKVLGQTQPVQKSEPAKVTERTSTNTYQNILMTDPKSRDQANQTNGKNIGEIRAQYGLTSFEDIQKTLEGLINDGLKPKDYLVFRKEGDKVMLIIVTPEGFSIPVSTIQTTPQQGSEESKKLIDLIYSTDIDTLNKLILSGVIDFKITNFVNLLSSSEKNNTLDSLVNLVNDKVSISLFDGNTNLSTEENYVLQDLSEEALVEKGAEENSISDNLNVKNGYHIRVKVETPDGTKELAVKARLKTHDNAEQLVNNLKSEIQSLLDEQSKIEDKKSNEYLNFDNQIRTVVNKFNNEVFFSLEPIANVKRHLSIGYRASDKTLYFNLESKVGASKKYIKNTLLSKDSKLKFNNAIPVEDFDLKLIVEALNQTNINPNKVFTAEDIKYNSLIDVNGKLDLSRLTTPLDNNRLIKHGIELKLNEAAQPVTTAGVITSEQSYADKLSNKPNLQGTVTANSTTTIDSKKADIERRREEELEEESYRITIKSELHQGEDGTFYKVQLQKDGKNKISIADENGRTLAVLDSYDSSVSFDKIIAGGLTKVRDLEFTNKIVDKINAKYDAELAALQSKPTQESNELTQDLELLKDPKNLNTLAKKYNVPSNLSDRKKIIAIENIINNAKSSDDTTVFSIGFEESTGITEAELESVKKILPSFITIDDIKTIALNLRVKGIPFGAFKNKVIYLNTLKGKPGTAYHEAFHAVFRTMLTDKQIDKYLFAAAEEFKKSGKDIHAEMNKLKNTVKNYESKSEGELLEIVLEEYLADRFAEYSQTNKEPKQGILKQLFFKIKNFFNKVFGKQSASEEIEMLFGNILKGSFVNATEISNRYTGSSDTVFKLLPKKQNAIQNGFFTAQESRKIINTFAIKVHKAKQGLLEDNKNLYNIRVENNQTFYDLKSDEDLIDYFINERVNDLNTKAEAYIDSIYEQNPEEGLNLTRKVEEELFLYNPENINSLGVMPRTVLESSILDKLSLFDYKTNSSENDNNTSEEDAEYKDKFGSQDAWLSGGHDSLSRTIKEFASFTTVVEKDILTNEDVERAIDEVTLYNGLTRILADTSEENMIGKLYDVAESNPNIKAFYERIINELDLTYDPKTNTVVYPSDPYKNNIVRAILTNFKKSKVSQLNVLIDSVKKDLKWINANSYDPANVSLDLWTNNLQNKLAYGKVNSESLSRVSSEIYNASRNKLSQKITMPELNRQAELIKQRFDYIGMPLTTAYIKVSLLKAKAELENVSLTKDFFTEEQLSTLAKFDKVVPIDFTIFGGIGTSKTNFSINDIFTSDPMSLYKGKEADSKLKSIAENNAMFDESIGNFSFTNAEGERVYEIINGSYVLSAISRFKDQSFWKEFNIKQDSFTAESKNKEFIKNNFLLNSEKYRPFLTDLKLNILSGFRDTTLIKGSSQEGLTFGKFDARTYLLSALSLFDNNKKANSAKYIFRQNEASNTAYVVELPKIDVLSKDGSIELQTYFKNQFLNEYNRISREYKLFNAGKTKIYKAYNDTLNGRAFDFTEFQYLKDILGSELYNTFKDKALNGETLTEQNLNLILEAIGVVGNRPDSFLKEGFKEFKSKIDSLDLRLFLEESWKENSDAKLYQFYVNDYIMSSAMNELLDGDYALSRKDKVDISKRNKSAMASGPDYGKGNYNAAVIKDVDLYTTIKPINGKLVRVEAKDVIDKSYTVINGEKYEVSKYTANDAQTYSSQYHIMMGSLRLGRMDKVTRDAYKNIIQFTKRNANGEIVRNVNIGESNQKHLAKTLASLNSKKTIVFDGIAGQLLKMSELGLIRSSISYVEDANVDQFVNLTNELTDLMFQDDFESPRYRELVKQISKLYKPVPGMEYWHNLANNMDLNEIDHAVTESASKGATLIPEDTKSGNYDLSKSKFTVQNKNKRLQVETPTGKKEIVFGSQILNIITSEQNDDLQLVVNGEKTTVGNLKKIYNESIAHTRDTSFKKALKVVKEINGKFDKSELDAIVKNALVASNANEQLMQYFEGGYNYNMVQMLVKAEQVILAHFSKGVLAQKVNGEKVSLVSDVGVNVVYDLTTNEVISHHEIVKNPSLYADNSKYGTRSLQYNIKDPKTGIIYSECLLSQTILTKHGLKIGDKITPEMSEVLQSIGYRIPTGDKQSALSLRVVGLLPDYYQGIGVFPSEIVHLSGADFDIDSEFMQFPYFWYKKENPTQPIKFGKEKTLSEAWEAFKFYQINYNKDFSKQYKDLLKKDFRYRSLKQEVKNLENLIDQSSKKDKQDLILTINGLKGQMEIIEHNYYGQVSQKFDLPYLEKDFANKGFQPNAVANNKALDAMIQLLTNESMVEIANNTTSTDALKEVRNDLKQKGFIKDTNISKVNSKNKTAHDVNGKLDANTKNSEGKNGIGVIANKIQQFAFLMSKSGDKVVNFNPDSFKFKIAGYTGGKYEAGEGDQRTANKLNVLLNVFTDNAKDPIAGDANIKFELLPAMSELIMQGLPFDVATKFVNIPGIQKYGELLQRLNSGVKTQVERSFNKNSVYTAAVAHILYGNINKKTIEQATQYLNEYEFSDEMIDENQIDNLILNSESTDESKKLQIDALTQLVKVKEQYDVMSNINTLLKLNQGLDISFNDVTKKLQKSIDLLNLNELFNIDKKSTLNVEPHINISSILKDDKNTYSNVLRALEVVNKVGKKIFIEQTDSFKTELNKLNESLNNAISSEESDKISKEFLGFLSVRSYIQQLSELKNLENTSDASKKAIQARLDSINYGLMFQELNSEGKKTLARQLNLLKINPLTKDNVLVKYLTTKLADDGFLKEESDNTKFKSVFDYIETKSFVKESNETISLLVDSVNSLFYNNTVIDEETGMTPRDFVSNMFSYLIVKDNMLFKNNSVAKYLPATMFGKYSETLDNLVEELNNPSSKLNISDYGYLFRKFLATDANTKFNVLKFKELSKELNSIKINSAGEVEFNIGRKFDLAVAKSRYEKNEYLESDKKSLEGIISELEKEVSSENVAQNLKDLSDIFTPVKINYESKGEIKQKTVFKFPQFYKFKVNNVVKTYELVKYKSDISEFNIAGSKDFIPMNSNLGYVEGHAAFYQPLETIGTKGLSVYSFDNYDTAVTQSNIINEAVSKLKGSNFSDINSSVNDNVIQKELTPEESIQALKEQIAKNQKSDEHSNTVSEEPVKTSSENILKTQKKEVSLNPEINAYKSLIKDFIDKNLDLIKQKASQEELNDFKLKYKEVETFNDALILRRQIEDVLRKPGNSPLNEKC